MTELTDHLTAEPVDYETFRVDSESRAIWAMRKLSVATQRLAELDELAKDEIAKINDWRTLAGKSAQTDVTFFENSLKAYLLSLREADPETKSLKLPDGELTSRSLPAKAAVQDEETFIKWANVNGREGWIRTKESANLEAMKDHLSFDGDAVIDAETGEVVSGLVAIEADVSVTVRVSHP